MWTLPISYLPFLITYSFYTLQRWYYIIQENNYNLWTMQLKNNLSWHLHKFIHTCPTLQTGHLVTSMICCNFLSMAQIVAYRIIHASIISLCYYNV